MIQAPPQSREEVTCNIYPCEDEETVVAFELLRRAFIDQHRLADEHLSLAGELVARLLEWIVYACLGVANTIGWATALIFNGAMEPWMRVGVIVACNILGFVALIIARREVHNRYLN